MRYFIDTEFHEMPDATGGRIELISIGIVCETGKKKYYAVSKEFDYEAAKKHNFLMREVLPKLPPKDQWKTRTQIRDEILDFIGKDENPLFWGYFADYDWVNFCWLFGPMYKLPKHFPKLCLDLMQSLNAYGITRDKLPKQEEGAHDALKDAEWIKDGYFWLCSYLSGIARRNQSKS